MTRTTLVLATTAGGPSAPSFRVRVGLFQNELLRSGITVDAQPLFTHEDQKRSKQANLAVTGASVAHAHVRQWQNARTSPAQVALVSRQTNLSPLLATERAVAADRRLVYDVDDAVWFSARPEAGGHPLAFVKRSREKARWLASRAETVMAGNEILAEWLSAYSRDVVVVPSVVPEVKHPRRHVDGEEVVLGWIGSHSTARYLRAITPLLSGVAATLSPRPVRLLVVGAPAFPVPGVVTESVPWSEESERWALARMDVGVMPLPDNLWTRGKCAYKSLQYMSAAVPVVAHNVGITKSVIENNHAGVVVDGSPAFAHAIGELARDPALRNRMGACGREVVERDFSVQRWAPTVARILCGRA